MIPSLPIDICLPKQHESLDMLRPPPKDNADANPKNILARAHEQLRFPNRERSMDRKRKETVRSTRPKAGAMKRV